MILTTLATSVMIIVRTNVWVLWVPLAQAVPVPPALALPRWQELWPYPAFTVTLSPFCFCRPIS